jgi:hypothetical protein
MAVGDNLFWGRGVMRDRPTGAELLDVARETLLTELLSAPKDEQRLLALMIGNAMAIAAREAEIKLGDEDVSRDLVEAIREAAHDSDRALYERLLADVRARVALSNPKYLEAGG